MRLRESRGLSTEEMIGKMVFLCSEERTVHHFIMFRWQETELSKTVNLDLGVKDNPCERQLRLVWEPLQTGFDGYNQVYLDEEVVQTLWNWPWCWMFFPIGCHSFRDVLVRFAWKETEGRRTQSDREHHCGWL